ncbi:MAG: FadR family transcriptional regulator [Microbacteriaceae bacterium]|nr:MAG: FadR family transcriptional regulator [Microbacteriaceae bacterium]
MNEVPGIRANRADHALLAVLQGAAGPIGARQIRGVLRARGIPLSESTLARRLRELDELGVTEPVGKKGRLLTPWGRSQLETFLRVDNDASQLVSATQVKTAQDVLYLLEARRAIEPEAVYGSALSINSDEIESLRNLVLSHSTAVDQGEFFPRDIALGFHRQVTGYTNNPLVGAMLSIVLDPSLDRIEKALDVILESRDHGSESINEHKAIVEELASKNGQRAADLMRAHISRLIRAVEEFNQGPDPSLLERLINWKQ